MTAFVLNGVLMIESLPGHFVLSRDTFILSRDNRDSPGTFLVCPDGGKATEYRDNRDTLLKECPECPGLERAVLYRFCILFYTLAGG